MSTGFCTYVYVSIWTIFFIYIQFAKVVFAVFLILEDIIFFRNKVFNANFRLGIGLKFLVGLVPFRNRALQGWSIPQEAKPLVLYVK